MFGVTALVTAGALLALVASAFVVGVSTGRHTIMDVAWGGAIALAGAVSFVASIGHGVPGRRWPLAAAAVLWGVRLAWHVAVRARGAGEDPRYRELPEKAPGSPGWYALRTVYLPQLLILWVACAPLPAGMTTSAAVGPITVIGGVVWLAGFVFEVVGDAQLAPVPGRSGQQGPGHGPRAVAVHQAPELLRRRVHVVGAVRAQLRVGRPARDPAVAVADDVHLDQGHRPANDRSPDGVVPPRLRRLCRADQRVQRGTLCRRASEAGYGSRYVWPASQGNAPSLA